MKTLLLFLVAVGCLSAQTSYRVDPTPVITTSGSCQTGQLCQALLVPGSTISIATYPAGASVTTYTDSTLGTPCPQFSPVTYLGSNGCKSTTGQQAQFGFWLATTGNFSFTVRTPSGSTYGPFPFTVGTGGNTGQVSWVTQVTNKPFVDPREFDFAAQTPGGSLIIGSNSISMAPCPFGVAGTDSRHYLYVSGGSGTAEPVLITGGSCTSGATTGTLIVTAAHTHSGAWTVRSATAGGQEGLYSTGTAVTVVFPQGGFTIHGPILLPSGDDVSKDPLYGLSGQGQGTTQLIMASDYPTTMTGMVTFANPGPGGTVKDLTFKFPSQPDSTNIALYTHWPPALDGSLGTAYVNVTNVDTINAWVSVYGPTANPSVSSFSASVFHNMHISGYGGGMVFGAGMGDFTRISDVYFGPYIVGTSNNTTAFVANAIGMTIADGFFDIANYQSYTFKSLVISGGRVAVSNWQPDGGNGLVMSGGLVNISGGYSTLGIDTLYAVQITGGDLLISNMTWEKQITSTLPFVTMTAAAALHINNVIAITNTSAPFLTSSASNAFISVKGVEYFAGATADTFVSLTGANTSVEIANCNLTPTTGVGAKLLAQTSASGVVKIIGNNAVGWGIDAQAPSNANDSIIITNNNGIDTTAATVASAGALFLPYGPSTFLITGTTGVTAVGDIYNGRNVTLITTDGAVTFTASGTIGNTITSTQNVPLSGTVTGGKLYLH